MIQIFVNSDSAENVAVWIWRRVSDRIARERWPCRLAFLRLRLTPDFAVELEGLEERAG